MASTSDDTTNAPIAGVDTSSAPMSARERKKREVEEKMKANKRAKEDRETALRDARLTQSDGRIAERTVIKNSIALGAYTFSTPPTLQLLVKTLGMLQGLLLSQEWVRRRQDGILNLTAFQRADPVGALARAANDEGDVREAALKMLAIIQVLYDYVTARTGDASQIAEGREASRDPEERNREAPAWSAADGGYTRLNFGIDEAASPEGVQAFHDWGKSATQEDIDALAAAGRPASEAPARIPNVETMCPAGDAVQPPVFVAAPARKSKSVPMLTIAAVALLIKRAKVAISVAPNKIAPLGELNNKIKKMGLIEAGIARLATTLGAQLGNGTNPADAIEDFREANLFTYSHDVGDHDIKAFNAWVDAALADGYAVISIHDEADTLVKKVPKAGAKAPAIELLRPNYSLSRTRTVLVGATLLATVQDDSLWGSLLHREPHDMVAYLCAEGLLIPPLEPTDQSVQYIGIDHCVDVKYSEEDPANKLAFTFRNVLDHMKELRPSFRYVQEESAKARLLAAQSKAVVPLTLADGTLEHITAAQARHDSTVAVKQLAVDAVMAKTRADYYKPDEVPKFFPSMPQGNLHIFHDEAGTAMLGARTRAFIATSPLEKAQKRRADDVEEHWLSKALVVSCTATQQASKTDLAGGLGGYVKLAIEEALAQGQPLAVLSYTSVGVAGIARSTGIPPDADHTFNPADQVKLFLVMRVRSEEVKEDDDGVPEEEEYVWACCPFTAHADAPAALAKAHAVFVEMGCPHLIPSMRVIYVGYDMFAAATTLSCSDLTIRFTDGDSEQRVHYLPKSMVLCHAMLKQLNVLYQMLGRSMNLLQSIILDGYTIDVLTHPYTLARVKCYYLIEQFMVKCMKGAAHAELRQPDKMMGALVQFAEEQTKTFGLPVDEFLGKSRVGLRNLSLNATLDKGDKRNGGELVDLSDLRAPGVASSTGASDYDDDDGDYVAVGDFVGEHLIVQGTHEVAKDIFGWRGCIGKPEAQWPVRPNFNMEATGNMTDRAAANKGFIDQCTLPEKDALVKQPTYRRDGTKASDGKPAFYDPLKLAPYTDLVCRVLPVWFALAWKLAVYKQWDGHDASVSEAQRVNYAKEHAHRMWSRARAALGFLICTGQLAPIPNQENWITQLTTFTEQLGDTPERRKQALQHMLRALAWNTAQHANHTNHVTDLSIFLERLLACKDVKSEPWNMPELKKKPDWFAKDARIISRTAHVDDADVCTHEEYTLDTTHDPLAQPMDYLTLP